MNMKKYKQDEQNKIPPPITSVSLKELLDHNYGPVTWIADGLIPDSALTIISGSPASYKTWLILDLALCVATGKQLFGRFSVKQSPVLFIDEENGLQLLQARVKLLHDDTHADVRFTDLIGFKVSAPAIARLIDVVKEHHIGLIIIDSLVRIHSKDENDATAIASVFELLRAITKMGVAVVLTHHNRKQGKDQINLAQEMRGSSDILAAVDCHIAVTRNRDDDTIIVAQTKLRTACELKPFRLRAVKDGDGLSFVNEGEFLEAPTKSKRLRAQIIEIIASAILPLNKKEIESLLKESGAGCAFNTLKSALEYLVNGGFLYERKGKRGATYYWITQITDDQMAQITSNQNSSPIGDKNPD